MYRAGEPRGKARAAELLAVGGAGSGAALEFIGGGTQRAEGL